MRRLHLFELHEEPWFPDLWRTIFRAGLGQGQKNVGAFVNTVPKIRQLLDTRPTNVVLDLCSGSGETTLHIQDLLRQSGDGSSEVRFLLSDLFPEVELFERHRAQRPESIDFYREPVDALYPPDPGRHFRSIFASLHHFRPDDVKTILEDAAHRSDGIFVLESTSRNWKSILYSLPTPLAAIVMCGFGIRPWRPAHLLWSVLIPVIPAVVLWDSVISALRSYTVDELREITDSIEADDFVWDVGTVPMAKMDLPATYVIGRRKSTGESPDGKKAAEGK